MLKVVEFKPKNNKDIKELKELINSGNFKSFLFAGLHDNGMVSTFASETSVIDLCGLLAFIEKDVKRQIEV